MSALTADQLFRALECDKGGCECHRSLKRLEGRTHCPAHHDENPSLSVSVERGNLLWRCHAGCTQEAVTAAIAEIGVKTAPIESPPKSQRAREVATYDYVDEAGQLLYQAVRYQPKDFRQRKPKPGGGWDWKLSDARRVLYQLPQLLERPTRRVLLVEGEKDADRLNGAGVFATTYAGGAKAPWQPEWSELLRGRKVTIVPDADVPGIDKALRDAAALADVAAELTIVPLPGLEIDLDHGQDVSDWLDAGHDVDELKALVAAAPTWSLADVDAARALTFDVELDRELPLGDNLTVGVDSDAPLTEDAPPGPVGIQLTVRSFDDLANLPGAEATWVVERFLAVGATTELTAFIKVGKSSIADQLVAAVLHGKSFLGQFKALTGPVVMLTEEPVVSLRPALIDAGVESGDPIHIVLWSENATVPWQQAAQDAAALCLQTGAKLLVVDTISWWAGVEEENDSSQARAAMQWLLHAASQGVAVLVLRHGRKAGGEIHNAGRGSSAYGGAADILLNLDYVHDEKGRAKEDSPERVLRMKSRLERSQPAPLRLTYEHGLYLTVDKPAPTQSGRLETLKRQVWNTVRSADEAPTFEHIREAVPSRKSDLLEAIRQLLEVGDLVRDERSSVRDSYRYRVVVPVGSQTDFVGPGVNGNHQDPYSGTDGNRREPTETPHARALVVSEPLQGSEDSSPGTDEAASVSASVPSAGGSRDRGGRNDPWSCPRCGCPDYQPLDGPWKRCLARRCGVEWNMEDRTSRAATGAPR